MQALFEEHQTWAAAIATKVGRGLPPSFDPADLAQVALIQHWRCVESFDSSRGVPYRAYAFTAIHGAVLMACRRKNYREATHDELKGNHVDGRMRPDELLIAREEWRNRLGPRLYRQRMKVRAAIEVLPTEDANLVRLVFMQGVEVEELERSTPGIKRRVLAAVRRLKRLVRDGTPAVRALRDRGPQGLVA